jgi:hypothetical protein
MDTKLEIKTSSQQRIQQMRLYIPAPFSAHLPFLVTNADKFLQYGDAYPSGAVWTAECLFEEQ